MEDADKEKLEAEHAVLKKEITSAAGSSTTVTAPETSCDVEHPHPGSESDRCALVLWVAILNAYELYIIFNGGCVTPEVAKFWYVVAGGGLLASFVFITTFKEKDISAVPLICRLWKVAEPWKKYFRSKFPSVCTPRTLGLLGLGLAPGFSVTRVYYPADHTLTLMWSSVTIIAYVRTAVDFIYLLTYDLPRALRKKK